LAPEGNKGHLAICEKINKSKKVKINKGMIVKGGGFTIGKMSGIS
jgi:hypothetical protein